MKNYNNNIAEYNRELGLTKHGEEIIATAKNAISNYVSIEKPDSQLYVSEGIRYEPLVVDLSYKSHCDIILKLCIFDGFLVMKKLGSNGIDMPNSEIHLEMPKDRKERMSKLRKIKAMFRGVLEAGSIAPMEQKVFSLQSGAGKRYNSFAGIVKHEHTVYLKIAVCYDLLEIPFHVTRIQEVDKIIKYLNKIASAKEQKYELTTAEVSDEKE